MLELVLVATVLTSVLLVAAASAPLPMRAAPRRRRTVGPRRYALARRCGFRYSYVRDALVLRGVGRRWGPVLRLRDDARVPLAGLVVAEPPAAAPPEEVASARTVDVVCMPLPRPHRAQRLWQLTAVELESRRVWVELTCTRGEPPQPQLAARFVREIGNDLAQRGERLDAIVVRSGGTQRWPQIGAEAGVPLQRLPPGTRHERLAANMHARMLGSFWHDVFARDEVGSLDALRRGLEEWTRRSNDQLAPAPAR